MDKFAVKDMQVKLLKFDSLKVVPKCTFLPMLSRYTTIQMCCIQKIPKNSRARAAEI